MSGRLSRLRELLAGGFEVLDISSDALGIHVRLQQGYLTLTLTLRRDDARALLHGGGDVRVRAARTLVRP